MTHVHGKRLLLVDDETTLLRLWKRAFDQEGFHVVCAENGERAISILEGGEIDVVFSDINMPGITGVQLLEYCNDRRIPACVNVLTGVASVGGAVQCMRLGACDYIGKPCQVEEMIAMAYRCLHHKTQKEELAHLNEKVAHLSELDRLKSEFVSNVSHELRTPLFSATAAWELLSKNLPAQGDDGKNMKMSAILSENLKRLGRLVSDVLNFARIEKGTLKPHFQKTDPVAIVHKNLDALIPLIEKREQAVQLKIEPSPFCPEGLLADPGQIDQILTNLLGNAIKFTPPGGKIGVILTEEENAVRFCVSDTGPGIAGKHQRRIFDRFFQVDGSTTREAGGTGIGLAVVKAIVEMHGGRIWVESEEGKGSRFFVSLPKIAAPEEGLNK